MHVAGVVLSLSTRLGKAGMQIGKKLTQKSKAAAAKSQAHCTAKVVCVYQTQGLGRLGLGLMMCRLTSLSAWYSC